MRAFLGVVMLVLLGGCATALSAVTEGRTGRIEIPSLTIAAGGAEEATTVTGDLSLPAGTTGRVPGVSFVARAHPKSSM